MQILRACIERRAEAGVGIGASADARTRLKNGDALASAREAASLRLRPIIMTSVAMVMGMLPMAIGHGEGGDQVSPLGRAVIGGLLFSTLAVLTILPLVFAWVQGKTTTQSPSLDPTDPNSKFYTDPSTPHHA